MARPRVQRKLSDLPYDDLVKIAREADYLGIITIPDRWTLRKNLVISRRLRSRARRLLLPILLGREAELRQLKYYKKILGIQRSESSRHMDSWDQEFPPLLRIPAKTALREESPPLPVGDGLNPTYSASYLHSFEVANMANTLTWKDLPSLRLTPLASLALEAGGSVRLMHAFERMSREGKVLFPTVGDYLDAGAEANRMFLCTRNIGKGTVKELRLIVDSALAKIGCHSPHILVRDDVNSVCRGLRPSRPEMVSMFATSMGEALSNLRLTPLSILTSEAGGSIRLMNGLEKMSKNGIFATVGSYLDAGAEAERVFLGMRNVGKGTVKELRLIVESALVRIGCRPSQDLDDDEKRRMFFENLSGSVDIIELLRRLKVKERQVVVLRFGLEADGPKTLEEVGQLLGVTRERVRQIESKSIKKLRRIGGKGLKAYLSEKSGEILARILGQTCALRDRDIRKIGHRLAPEEDLLIAVVHGGLETWLDVVAHRLRGGWVISDVDADALKEVSNRFRRIRKTFPEPLSLRRVAETLSIDNRLLQAVVALSGHFTSYLGYITHAPIRRRIRRALRTHLILGNQPRRMPMLVWQLRDSYTKKYPDDNCSTRDLEIVMGDARHLFLNLHEEGWAAIGDIGEHDGSVVDEGEPDDEAQDQEPVTELATERTVAGRLRAILHEKGPMQFDDLRQAFLKRTRGRYSPASVGPILIGYGRFVRFAPGVYGLRSQLGVPSATDQAMQVLMTPRHLELYCHARWASEPAARLYPMWTPKTEYRWAVWAKKDGMEELLHSLLAVADVGQWPVSEAGIATWRSLKERKGEFRLQERITVPLTETIPDLRDVAAVALFARARGNVSWMSANRVRGARIDDRHVHSVLGLLIGMGVLVAPSHWQCRHDYVPESNHLVDVLIGELETSPSGRWTQTAVDTLWKNMQANKELGWVDNDQLWILIDEIRSMTCDAGDSNAESQAKDRRRTSESSLQQVLNALKAKKAIALAEGRVRVVKGRHRETKDGRKQYD